MSINRIDLYLQEKIKNTYLNTDKENELIDKFNTLYSLALSAQQTKPEANHANIKKWRKAYLGTLGALKSDGTESERKSRQLRKLIYEVIESKVDNSIPMPKIKARYKSDLPIVTITEDYLKYEVDTILSRYNNDRSERAVYVDGTGWYKVWWDSLSRTHKRSGNVRVDFCTADQIVPQPGIIDYRDLEYIFEVKLLSVSKIYDTYGRLIEPNSADNNVEVISCYYLNNDGIVGLFSWAKHSLQVICNEEDWQIRKLRECTICHEVVPQSTICPNCGSESFKFVNASTELLDEDLYMVYNPYEVGETDNPAAREQFEETVYLSAGTEIPYYHIRQLPFVPRPAVSSIDSLYGISEVGILLEMQDNINKVLTKAVDKTLKSGTILTKPQQIRFADTDDTIKILAVQSPDQAQMITSKEVQANTQQDLFMANILYDSAKAASGITDSFQGAKDTTATSGKAKEFSAAQSAGRIESLRVMKSAAFSGVYELVLKYLLAFSDESRKFVRVLPDGTTSEDSWNKYMFLDKDESGIYYRDDLSFDCDPASTLSQNRVQMWQETQDKFIHGMFGALDNPRTLTLLWNVLDSLQYPLADVALANLQDQEQHLPYEIEQAIMQSPELQQILMQAMQQMQDGRGGARPNSGPEGNGATHEANVERTNERNRAQNRDQAFSAQQASTAEGVNT